MTTSAPTDVAAPSTTISPAISPLRFAQAYEELIEEIEAVEDDGSLSVFTDVRSATVRVFASLPKIMSLRDKLVALADFDVVQLDKLESYTLAAAQSQMNFNIISSPSRSIQDVHAGLLKHRANFTAIARVLEINELLDAATLKTLGSANNYQLLAFDVMTLVGLFRRNWATIAGKCPLTQEMLADAEDLSSRMFVAVGVKGREPETISAAGVTRRKAFALFARAYNEVTRGVTYLRWHQKDIDSYVPNLATPRKRPSDPGAEEVTEEPEAPVVAAPVQPLPVIGAGSTGFPSDEPVGRG